MFLLFFMQWSWHLSRPPDNQKLRYGDLPMDADKLRGPTTSWNDEAIVEIREGVLIREVGLAAMELRQAVPDMPLDPSLLHTSDPALPLLEARPLDPSQPPDRYRQGHNVRLHLLPHRAGALCLPLRSPGKADEDVAMA